MELIWALSKMLEYLFVVPLWWIATYLAAFFYPLEHDPRQDFLGLIFSFIIIAFLIFACYHWLGSPDTPQQTAAQKAADEKQMQELNATMKLLSPTMPTGTNP